MNRNRTKWCNERQDFFVKAFTRFHGVSPMLFMWDKIYKEWLPVKSIG